MVCHATTGNEMTHITKLAARQRTAKRTGRPQVVNCQMRVKPAAPLALNGENLISFVKYDCACNSYFKVLLRIHYIENACYIYIKLINILNCNIIITNMYNYKYMSFSRSYIKVYFSLQFC